MAYSDAKSLADRSTGIAGVAIVHAGLGSLVVLGLAASVVVEPDEPRIPRPLVDIEVPPPPPPPKDVRDKPDEPKTAKPKTPDVRDTTIVAPPTPFNPPSSGPEIGDAGPYFPPAGSDGFGDVDLGGIGGGGDILPKSTPTPTPTPTFAFDPVGASPKNNAGRWVTDSDYRSSWIRRGMTGVAKFSLGVGANGRVTDCRITSSTGYDALDNATCKLIAKRARFNPAKDGNGAAVSGDYSSSIRWVLPE